MQTITVPENVKKTPAGPGGNGFVALGLYADSIVGDDGEVYTRKNGEITVASDEAE